MRQNRFALRFLTSLMFGFFIAIALIIVGVASPPLRPFVDTASTPGYAFAQMIWGEPHDPIMVGLVLFLNSIVYGLAVLVFRFAWSIYRHH